MAWCVSRLTWIRRVLLSPTPSSLIKIYKWRCFKIMYVSNWVLFMVDFDSRTKSQIQPLLSSRHIDRENQLQPLLSSYIRTLNKCINISKTTHNILNSTHYYTANRREKDVILPIIMAITYKERSRDYWWSYTRINGWSKEEVYIWRIKESCGRCITRNNPLFLWSLGTR